jgi:hypothetical protein
MGYADLDLVKNTFKQPQFPLIQGEQGEHRHFYGIEQSDRVTSNIIPFRRPFFFLIQLVVVLI